MSSHTVDERVKHLSMYGLSGSTPSIDPETGKTLLEDCSFRSTAARNLDIASFTHLVDSQLSKIRQTILQVYKETLQEDFKCKGRPDHYLYNTFDYTFDFKFGVGNRTVIKCDNKY